MNSLYFQIKLIFISFILLFITNCASAPEPKKPSDLKLGDYSYAKDKIDWIISKRIKDLNIQGLSVAVVNGKETLFQKGYGYANKSNNIKVTEDTLFKIGSVSKIFTSLCILKLVEEGKINLDKEIIFYLPELKIKPRYPDSKFPTVRELMIHHGGMPSDIFHEFFFDENPPDGYDRKFASLASRLDGYMAQKPGIVMAYSNLSFSILGILIEKVSGKTLENFAKEKIFNPIEMKNTSYLDHLPPDLASMGFNGSKEIQMPKIRDLAAGSISSSASEMSQFMKMILSKGAYRNNIVFKSSTLDQMYIQQNENALYDSSFKIGLTYWISNKNNEEFTIVGHGGDLPPFHAYLLLDVKNDIGISILVNSNASSIKLMNLANSIHEIVLESKTGYKPKEFKEPEPIKFVESDFKKWEGQYVAGGKIINISSSFWNKLLIESQALYLQPTDNGKLRPEIRILFGLIPLPASILKGIEFYFETAKDGKKILFQEVADLKFPFIEYKPIPTLDIWKKRTGSYKIINPEKKPVFDGISIDYNKKEDKLTLTYKIDIGIFFRVPIEIVLLTEKEDVAFVAGIGRNLGEPVYVTMEDSKEVLNFMGYKLVKD